MLPDVINSVSQAENSVLVAQYLDNLALEQLSEQTLSTYRRQLQRFAAYVGAVPFSVYIAKKYLADMRAQGSAQQSIELAYHALRPFMASLGMPFTLRFKRHCRLPPYHSVDQVKAILAAVQSNKDNFADIFRDRNTLIVYILAYTGIRRAELCGLRVRDYDSFHRTLRVVGKGDQERIVPVVNKVAVMIDSYITAHGLTGSTSLFSLRGNRVAALIRRFCTMAGVHDMHTHSFRHFCATQLVEAGIPIHQIKELLGHADISTTALYLDIAPGKLQQAVERLPDF